MKKLRFLLFFSVALFLVGCSQNNMSTKEDYPEQKKILIIRNQSDYSDIINQQILQGVEEIKNQISNVRIDISEKGLDMLDIENDIRNFAKDGGELVIITESKYISMVQNLAQEYPELKFSMIDGEIYDLEQYENIESLIFDPFEIGYFMGYISGRLSETGKVAFIGGFKDNIRTRVEDGFKSGIRRVRESIKQRISYVGPTREGFTSPQLAFAIANRNFIEGYDIIAHSAEDSAEGIFDAAIKNRGFVIGYGVDQTVDVREDEKKIFYTSITKKFNVGISMSIRNFLTEFKAGNYFLNLKQEAIDYVISAENPRIKDLTNELESLKGEIISN